MSAGVDGRLCGQKYRFFGASSVLPDPRIWYSTYSPIHYSLLHFITTYLPTYLPTLTHASTHSLSNKKQADSVTTSLSKTKSRTWLPNVQTKRLNRCVNMTTSVIRTVDKKGSLDRSCLRLALICSVRRASLKQVAVKAALLVDGADDGGGHVEADPVIEGLGEEALGLDIGQPGAAGLGLGEGDVVTELNLLACFLFESE